MFSESRKSTSCKGRVSSRMRRGDDMASKSKKGVANTHAY